MLRFDDKGLIPVVVQDAATHRVLTVAYMNAEAVDRSLSGPDVWFYSRSRGELWHKGETSGNFLKVKSIEVDCDGDALLVTVEPTGPACHTGETSCFHRALPAERNDERSPGPAILSELFDVIEDRRKNPAGASYTSKLFARGRERIAQKLIEEAGETAIAGLGSEPKRMVEESADLLYNVLVLASAAGVKPDDIWAELARRRKAGGGAASA